MSPREIHDKWAEAAKLRPGKPAFVWDNDTQLWYTFGDTATALSSGLGISASIYDDGGYWLAFPHEKCEAVRFWLGDATWQGRSF